MDIGVYETFLEVARTKNFRTAAGHLDVVQSTVSSRIQSLENAYGVALFNREHRQVSLSNAGKALFPYAQRIVNLHKRSLSLVKACPEKTKLFAIGTELNLYESIVKKNIDGMFCRWKDTRLELDIDVSQNLLAKVYDGLLDMAFVYNKPQIRTQEQREIVVRPLLKDHFVFLLPFEKNVSKKTIDFKTLLEQDLVYKDYGENFFQWICRLLPKNYHFSLSLDVKADAVSHIVNGKMGGFVLMSEYKRHPLSHKVQAVSLEGISTPYIQSYCLYRKEENDLEKTQMIFDCMQKCESDEIFNEDL